MGLLGDIIKTIQESIEEAQAQADGRPRRRPMAPSKEPVQSDAQREYKRQESAQAKRIKDRADRVRKENAEEMAAFALTNKNNAANRINIEKLRRDLHHPASLQQMVVMKEILDRPLAMRRGRR